jgi:hypothetical protein
MSKSFFKPVCAAAIAVLISAAVSAANNLTAVETEDGLIIQETVRSPVEEFTPPQSVRQMEPVVDTPEDDGRIEFVPKNETIFFTPPGAAETAPSAPADTAAKEARQSEHNNIPALGLRMGLGNAFNLGASIKIPLGTFERLDLTAAAGFGGGRNGYRAHAFEALCFYERRFDIDDGVLGWFAGAGVAFGWYGTSGRPIVTIPATDTLAAYQTSGERERLRGFNVGVGGQFGIEVDLSFIDSDHALHSSFKNMSVGLDMRPMFYWPVVENYPVMVITVGLFFRYAL